MTFKPARLLVLLLAVAALPVMAQNVAVVNGKPIPTARMDSLLKDIEARGQKDTPELRKQIKDKLIELEILSQEAEKAGLSKDKDFTEKLSFIREQLLANALIQEHLKKVSVKDSDINAEYEKIKAQASKQTEYHARHILVDSEDDAKAIIVKLKGGAKFEDLAKEKSKEPGAANSGGDLGWSSPEGYVKPFSDAMVKLNKGQFTDTPVQTQFGWHVIKLEDSRPAKVPTFDEVKPRLAEMLKQKDMEDFLNSMKAKAKIQ
jgi:peptidyl-prolyl cis-trans isomerase C